MFKLIIFSVAVVTFIKVFNFVGRIVKKSIVIDVNVEQLFELEPIMQRANVYINNKSDKNICDYLTEHFREIGMLPVWINKVIRIQQRGYTVKFHSKYSEEVRPIIAHLLNLWGLKGELYLNDTNAK